MVLQWSPPPVSQGKNEMGVFKVLMMACDKCERELEDSGGLVIGGNEKYLNEKADMAGWTCQDGRWYCGVCLFDKPGESK